MHGTAKDLRGAHIAIAYPEHQPEARLCCNNCTWFRPFSDGAMSSPDDIDELPLVVDEWMIHRHECPQLVASTMAEDLALANHSQHAYNGQDTLEDCRRDDCHAARQLVALLAGAK